jgi:hypothetical protein
MNSPIDQRRSRALESVCMECEKTTLSDVGSGDNNARLTSRESASRQKSVQNKRQNAETCQQIGHDLMAPEESILSLLALAVATAVVCAREEAVESLISAKLSRMMVAVVALARTAVEPPAAVLPCWGVGVFAWTTLLVLVWVSLVLWTTAASASDVSV